MVLDTIERPGIDVSSITTEVVSTDAGAEKYFDPQLWDGVRSHYANRDKLTPEEKDAFKELDIYLAACVAVAFPQRLNELSLTENDANSTLALIESLRKEGNWREYVDLALAYKITFPQYSEKLKLHESPRTLGIFKQETPWESIKKFTSKLTFTSDALFSGVLLSPENKNELPLEENWDRKKTTVQRTIQGFASGPTTYFIGLVSELAELRIIYPNHYSEIAPSNEQLVLLESGMIDYLDSIKNRKPYFGAPHPYGSWGGGVDYLVLARDYAIVTADKVTVDNTGIHLTFNSEKKSPDETHIQPEERSF